MDSSGMFSKGAKMIKDRSIIHVYQPDPRPANKRRADYSRAIGSPERRKGLLTLLHTGLGWKPGLEPLLKTVFCTVSRPYVSDAFSFRKGGALYPLSPSFLI